MKEILYREDRAVPVRSSVKVIKQRMVGNQLEAPAMDDLAIEDPLEIELHFALSGQKEKIARIVTMRTPGQDDELIHGYLYAEGVVKIARDVLRIDYNSPSRDEAPVRARVYLRPGIGPTAKILERGTAQHSGCGVCGSGSLEGLSISPALRIDDAVKITANCIHELPGKMNGRQAAFHKTGGLHAAALFSAEGELLEACEDIGRHNALDKAIGSALLSADLPRKGRILCVSGRMSYEILQKALMARIPVIAGVGAPSSLAVSLANDFNVTLIGFVRNQSYNIYSNPERIIP